jgi:hypothetical protein
MICLRSAAYCLCREKSFLFHEHVRLTNVDVKTQPCVATFSGEKSSGAGIIMQRPEAASIYQTALTKTVVMVPRALQHVTHTETRPIQEIWL